MTRIMSTTLAGLVAMSTAPGLSAEPAQIILDTDMAGDCDDTGALAVLHALADYGECEILAILTNRRDETRASAAAVDAINTWYGRPAIPIGTEKAGGGPVKPPRSSFTEALRDTFPHTVGTDADAPDALGVYRKALAAAPDRGVTICSIGVLSNLEDLLRTDRALVLKKVKRLVVMGGQFPTSKTNRPETNIVCDGPAAQYVIENWPGEILFTGFEVGKAIHAGSLLKTVTRRNPVRIAYELRPFGGRRSIDAGKPAYDQTAVLLAVRGPEPRYWDVVRGGRVEVSDDWHTHWKTDKNGKHAWVKIKGRPHELTGLIDRLMVKPPRLNPSLPVPMIFDTDLGADIDDALALAVIHGLARRGEVDLLAVTCSKDHPASASAVDMINTWFKRPSIPIGRVRDGKQPDAGRFLAQMAAAKAADGTALFPHTLTPETSAPEAVALMRKTLAAQADHSVVIAMVGQQTNAARLLGSGPDAHSPLSGLELVTRKVRMLSVMAGSFVTHAQGATPPKGQPEWNVKVDIDAARKVFHEWPTEIVVTPYLLGRQLLYPGSSIERDFDRPGRPHPVAYGYRLYIPMPYDRPSWDLVSVLYPSRANLGYFGESDRGRVTVDQEGVTTFTADPAGNTRILSATPEQRARIVEAFIGLATDRPADD